MLPFTLLVSRSAVQGLAQTQCIIFSYLNPLRQAVQPGHVITEIGMESQQFTSEESDLKN